MAFTYIDVDSGNDSNDGLSEATPKLTGGHIDWTSANPDYQIYLKGNTTNYLEYVFPTSGARSARPVISVFPSELNTGVKGKLRITKSSNSNVQHSGFTFVDLDIDDNNTATGSSGFNSGYCLRCNLDMVSITQNSTNVSPLTFDLGTIYQPTSGSVYWNPSVTTTVKETKMVDAYPNAGNLRLINSVYIVRDSWTSTIANVQTFYNSAIVYRSTSAATSGAIFSNGFATCLNTHIINLKNNNRPIIASALNISVGSIRTYGIDLTNFIDNGIGGATDVGVLTDEFESTNEADLLTTYMKIKSTSGAVDAGIGGADIGWAVLSTGGALLPVGDVKIGVDRGDGNLGTYDGSDRWTDPGIANVNLGVSYKANSLTDNRTGTNESTDPGIANVVSGVAYKINSTSYTGTRTAIYSLLAQNLVKLDTDRGDGALGTYDGSERYTDIDLSQVVDGYAFRYNSLSNNRTGTRTSIYPVLAQNLVKIDTDRGDGTFGTYTGAERYTDIDLSQIVDGYAFRYDSLTNNREGIRTAIYSLLNQNIVKIDEDRGDGALGTYDGSERYTDPDLSKVESTYSFRYNSLTNNRTGTKVFYPLLAQNLVKIDTDRGDGTLGTYDGSERYTDIDLSQVVDGYAFKYNSLTNNREGTRTAIYPLLNITEVKFNTDRGDGELGIYTGSERYTDLPQDKVENAYSYRYDSLIDNRTGTLVSGDVSSIDENKVVYPYEYAPGKIGQAGKFNDSLTDIVTQLNDNGKALIQHILGAEWKEMKFFKEPERNDFYSSDKYFGIRPLEDNENNSPISTEDIELRFEIKLLKQFENKDGDEEEREAELQVIEELVKLRRAMWHSNLGNYAQAVLIKDINRDEIETLGANIVMGRMLITINYALLNNL